jgi:hypothetical protein
VAPSRPPCRSWELSSPPMPYAGTWRSDRASVAAGPSRQGQAHVTRHVIDPHCEPSMRELNGILCRGEHEQYL